MSSTFEETFQHGGQVLAAAKRYGIPRDGWLDLSTGINPMGWPVPGVPREVWNRLPEDDDGLVEAASDYYGGGPIAAVPGTQAAIKLLPTLRPPARVAVLSPGYAEHRKAWDEAGHHARPVGVDEIQSAVDGCDVLVVSNPNNPDGHVFKPEFLEDWRRRLAAKGGWLVIDEAFVDPVPELSLAARAGAQALVILRSMGKFFGLAGMRVGFVMAEPGLLARLQNRLGPWSVNGPGRWVARQALRDRDWQKKARKTLPALAEELKLLLMSRGVAPIGGTPLFQCIRTTRARALYEEFARRGILTRYFPELSALRIGLPADQSEFQRLADALESVNP